MGLFTRLTKEQKEKIKRLKQERDIITKNYDMSLDGTFEQTDYLKAWIDKQEEINKITKNLSDIAGLNIVRGILQKGLKNGKLKERPKEK